MQKLMHKIRVKPQKTTKLCENAASVGNISIIIIISFDCFIFHKLPAIFIYIYVSRVLHIFIHVLSFILVFIFQLYTIYLQSNHFGFHQIAIIKTKQKNFLYCTLHIVYIMCHILLIYNGVIGFTFSTNKYNTC